MSTKPIPGGHVRLTEEVKPLVAPIYQGIDLDQAFLVEHVAVSSLCRTTVFVLPKEDPERRLGFWLSQVKAFPRCKWCNKEGHSLKSCKEAKEAAA
jgi:hypothetical protein